MKTKISLQEFNLSEISNTDAQSINGGGLFEFIGELIGATAHHIVNGIVYTAKALNNANAEAGLIGVK